MARPNRLAIAAEAGNAQSVERLLGSRRYNVHAKDEDALRRAARRGHSEVVELLLQAGADAHALEDEALREAALGMHRDTAALLVRYGADPDAALEHLALGEYAHAIRIVCGLGANVEANGNEALVTASGYAPGEVVGALIECGADPNARDGEPLKLAVKYGNSGAAAALLAAGASRGSVDPTALAECQRGDDSNLHESFRAGLSSRTGAQGKAQAERLEGVAPPKPLADQNEENISSGWY